MIRPVAALVLEDGTVFSGEAIGKVGTTVGEVVFHTAYTGYQEILSDPSYCKQIVTFTYPHIGNTGVNAQDMERSRLYLSGVVVRDVPRCYQNWRAKSDLNAFLREHGVVGIAGIDTRMLTRKLRTQGALKGAIVSPYKTERFEEALGLARSFPGLSGMGLADVVSLTKPTLFKPGKKARCVVIDCGVKTSILDTLNQLDVEVWVLPYDSTIEQILQYAPHGVLLSNGPGDPEPLTKTIQTTKKLIEQRIPIFGICLGIQILALAMGGKTLKMKFGHHGGNHPVKGPDGKVMITSQNHGFMLDEATLPPEMIITHRSLFDNSIQGVIHKSLPIMGFQGHPEAGPGPNDAKYLFSDFVAKMTEYAAYNNTVPYAEAN